VVSSEAAEKATARITNFPSAAGCAPYSATQLPPRALIERCTSSLDSDPTRARRLPRTPKRASALNSGSRLLQTTNEAPVSRTPLRPVHSHDVGACESPDRKELAYRRCRNEAPSARLPRARGTHARLGPDRMAGRCCRDSRISFPLRDVGDVVATVSRTHWRQVRRRGAPLRAQRLGRVGPGAESPTCPIRAQTTAICGLLRPQGTRK
jgi:hypothetical protein